MGSVRWAALCLAIAAAAPAHAQERTGELPPDLVAMCRAVERCAQLLRPDPAALGPLTEPERLEEAAWRTSIALAGLSVDPTWIPCATVANERVRRALERRFPSLAAASDCRVREARAGNPFDRRIAHYPSGVPAYLVRLVRIDAETADRAVSRSSYIAAANHASAWTCRYLRQGGEWAAQRCELTDIS